MQEVEHTQTLRMRLAAAPAAERRGWCAALLELVLALHSRGWYHRDLYLDHFVLGPSQTLHLLDVGRARRDECPRPRWFVKDLAALLHSAPSGMQRSEGVRFLNAWLVGMGLAPGGRAGRAQRRRWARAILRKERRLAAHAPRHVDVETPDVPPPRARLAEGEGQPG